MGLQPGTRMPAFSLPDQQGRQFDSDTRESRGPLVIFFYPRDETPGCTREVCAFRDDFEAFRKLCAEVVGISSDTQTSHLEFSRKNDLPYRLLADREHRVRKLFQVKGYLFNLVQGRETFVIDSSGIIRMAYNSPNPAQHVKKALQALKDIQA